MNKVNSPVKLREGTAPACSCWTPIIPPPAETAKGAPDSTKTEIPGAVAPASAIPGVA